MTRALLLATALFGLATPAPPPPRLRPAPGWTVIRPRRSEPSVSSSMAVAVTAADAARLEPFSPFLGFKRLSARGIIVWATTLGRAGTPTEFPPLRWPPLLSTFRVDHAWEGQPAANIQQRLKAGKAGGWNLDVRVYFATQRPDATLLAQAQAELRRLRLPATR